MFKLTLFIIVLFSASLKAQTDQVSEIKDSFSFSKEKSYLQNSVRSSPSVLSAEIDLNDFRNKIERGLDFMSPGSTISDIKCEKLTGWSDSQSEALISYLKEIRKDDIGWKSPGSVEAIRTIVSEFGNSNCKFGIMSWELIINSERKVINSVSVFDRNGKVLFDTELVKFITSVSDLEVSESGPEEDNNSPSSVSVIINQRSSSITYSYWVEGTFGSVRHYNFVSASAIVPPYITAATNDAFFNSQTTQIISERRDADPFAPPTEPCIYFGTGGTIANSYSSAVPFKSRVYLSNTNDHFNDGVYQISGTNGHNWSFSFDFSVSAGPLGLGITPQQNSPDFTLTSPNFSEVKVNNYVYYYLLGNTYRALFYSGGGLSMSNFNILTGGGSGETGSVNVVLPLQIAYWSYLILYPYTFTGVNLNISNVQYLRGDHIRQPGYRLSCSNYNIAVGQTDTLKARITNNSQYVKLKGGSISLNVSSLNDRLTLLSPATLPLDSINSSSSRTYNFIVRGNSNGIVTPQVNVSAAGWTWPVPPDVVINNIFSIDTNITVGSVSINQSSAEIPAEYSISQNYPNPFNPETKIDFSIPKGGFVKIIIYDVLGKEIHTPVNENLNAGNYNIDFNGNNLPSGVYFYRIISKDYSAIKRMTLLK